MSDDAAQRLAQLVAPLHSRQTLPRDGDQLCQHALADAPRGIDALIAQRNRRA